MSSDSDFLLIGFIESQDEVGDNINSDSVWRENFIGGRPVFSPNLSDDELRDHFSKDSLACESCGQSLAFLAQMNCPVDSKPIDRVIYILSCVNINCKSKKWKIFRVVTPLKDEDMSANGGGDGEANGTESMEFDGEPSFPIGVGCLHPPFEDKLAKFKAMYLSVEEEQFLVSEESNGKKNKSNGVVVEPKSNEVYEKFLIPGTDEVANKFIKTVSKFSRQVIRYAWNGKPLLNQDVKIKPGQCSSCKSKRTFELQIMPGFISQMKPIINESIELDFGTVLFFTCKNNCNDQSVHVEESFVLNDPDSNILPSFH